MLLKIADKNIVFDFILKIVITNDYNEIDTLELDILNNEILSIHNNLISKCSSM